MSLRHERDLAIQRIFTKYNFGSLPDAPFSIDVALNLTNRMKTRLSDVEMELQERKVHHFCVPYVTSVLTKHVYIYLLQSTHIL